MNEVTRLKQLNERLADKLRKAELAVDNLDADNRAWVIEWENACERAEYKKELIQDLLDKDKINERLAERLRKAESEIDSLGTRIFKLDDKCRGQQAIIDLAVSDLKLIAEMYLDRHDDAEVMQIWAQDAIKKIKAMQARGE